MTMGRPAIYGLALDGVIMYVGQSKNIKKRYAQHCSYEQNRGNRNINVWLRELHNRGIKPELVIIEETDDLDNREIHYIAEYRKKNKDLLNMADGGHTTSYITKRKQDKPWGNTHSPVQSILMELKRTIRMFEQRGRFDAADRIREKLKKVNSLIDSVGRDYMNDKLWERKNAK